MREAVYVPCVLGCSFFQVYGSPALANFQAEVMEQTLYVEV